ncbi:MAG: hypothetical protein ACREMV_06980 [Gemmatimonadales bacterium]
MPAARWVFAVGCAATGVAWPGPAPAQLALTGSGGAPSVFPAPTAADYTAGFVTDPAGVLFTVDATGGPANVTRTSIVSIRATSATLGGGKPIADLEWRRADVGVWTPMTTADAVVETRPIRRNNINDPWSNTLVLRIRLAWATDPPGTYSSGLVLTLTVTTP